MGGTSNNGYRVSSDSYDAYFGGYMPVQIYLAGGPESTEVKGNAFIAGTVGFGTPNTVSGVDPTAQGYAKLMGRFMQTTGPNTTTKQPEATGHKNSLLIYQQRMDSRKTITPGGVSINIANAFDPGEPSIPFGEGGISGEQAKIRFWRAHIDICGYGQALVTASSPGQSCSMSVSKNAVTITKPLDISGATKATSLSLTAPPTRPLSGAGHYACIDDAGNLYKSEKPCVIP